MAGKNKRKRNNKKNALKKSNLPDNEQQELVKDVDGEDMNESVEDEQMPAKRTNEDDSDSEETPKKKKKKKQPVPGDAAENKGKKSIRQIKKEKHAQRVAETEAASKDALKSQCINYLSQWKHDKPHWKFMKIKQMWLFKNKFSSNLVPESSWKTLIEYFESAQGNIRNLLLDDANKVIKQMDEWTESQKDKKQESTEEESEDTDDKKDPEVIKPDDTAYKRARDLIQCLN